MVFLWTGSSSHQQEPVGGAFQCVTGQHWVGYLISRQWEGRGPEGLSHHTSTVHLLLRAVEHSAAVAE